MLPLLLAISRFRPIEDGPKIYCYLRDSYRANATSGIYDNETLFRHTWTHTMSANC